jgi:hypothetical protein
MDRKPSLQDELDEIEDSLEKQRIEHESKLKQKRNVVASLGEGRNRMLPKAREGEHL